MKKLIVLLISILTLSVSGAGLVATAQPVFASSQSQVCSGIGGCNDNPAKISTTVQNIVNIFSAIIGVVTVIVVIIAGFQYVTSAGDSSKVGRAKTTLIYAIVGLLVVLLSQSLVKFVLSRS
jgi:hypothetical protein